MLSYIIQGPTGNIETAVSTSPSHHCIQFGQNHDEATRWHLAWALVPRYFSNKPGIVVVSTVFFIYLIFGKLVPET
ncbi:hypothetical protein VTN49DRAFT_2940 [Thermomyces lanuginosus]|uniref:uncharacterized protein n=1 Tax=Thermomyces lanuginosus TaxID=5541 RepID=UPI003743D695